MDYWTRIRKDVFEKWYRGQTKYRTVEDQKRDKVLEEAYYTIPEIARMLLVPRNTIYAILDNPKNEGVFETFIVAEKNGSQSRALKPGTKVSIGTGSWRIALRKNRIIFTG